MVQDRAIVSTADQSYGLSIGAIFSDPERPLTRITRSRQYSTMNILVTVEERHGYDGRRTGTRMWFIEWCHLQ